MLICYGVGNDMKTLPNIVKFIQYHWRHCAVFDPTTYKHLYDASVSMGWHHSPTGPAPAEQCKAWLKSHGYVLQTVGTNQIEVWIIP